MTAGPDPVTDELATPHLVTLAARLAAEPHVLAAWAQDTKHPALLQEYTRLLPASTQRAERIAGAMVEATPALRRPVARRVEHETRIALDTRFEPSRLKWLLSGRRSRLGQEELPGYEAHRADEQAEADRLETVLHEVLRTMC